VRGVERKHQGAADGDQIQSYIDLTMTGEEMEQRKKVATCSRGM
jgi:hypothetical protein